MKTNNFIKVCLSVALVVTISSCGKDNKNGNADGAAASVPILQANGQAGNPGSVYSIEDFRDRVSTGNFAEASASNVYYFAKGSSTSYSDTCYNGNYTGNFNQKYGARALNADSTIVRNFSIYRNGCSVQMSFDEDEFTGNNLTELAASMVSKINTAFSQHDVNNNVTIKKYINGYSFKAYPANYTCQVYENNCETIRSSDSKIWEIKVDGEWLVIDLTKAAIKQPVYKHL